MNPELVTEEEFTSAVVDLAKLCGWMVFHPRPCRTAKGYRTLTQGHPGFPDLTLVRRGFVLLVELKTERGKLSGPQLEWRAQAGTHHRVWRPSMMEEIRQTLR